MGCFISKIFKGLVEAAWNSEWRIFEDWPKHCKKKKKKSVVINL